MHNVKLFNVVKNYLVNKKNILLQATDKFAKQDSSDTKIKKSIKKGGPYSKNEKDKRREEVYRLCFEYGYSARKIAEMLDANRNTINGDINYWYSQISSQVTNETIVSSGIKQIYNMELQKTRLREQLDCTKEFSQKMAIERLLLAIDSKLAQHITKMMTGTKDLIKPIEKKPKEIKIPEEKIKKFVRDLILEINSTNEDSYIFSEDKMTYVLIRKTNANSNYVHAFLGKMKTLELGLCQQDIISEDESDYSQTYNMLRFAYMRNYITDDEFTKINKKIVSNIAKQEQIEKENKELALQLPKG